MGKHTVIVIWPNKGIIIGFNEDSTLLGKKIDQFFFLKNSTNNVEQKDRIVCVF